MSRIKTLLIPLVLLSAGCDPKPCVLTGQWVTTDAYSPASATAHPRAVVSTHKSVFVVGDQTEASGARSWVVRRSQDRAATWTLADQFRAESAESTRALGAAADPSRDPLLYVIGTSDAQPWMVRKSGDDGATWTLVDHIDSGHALPSGIAVDGSGAVYVAGTSEAGTALLRSSKDGGATWASIDLGAQLSVARAVVAGPNGEVFVAGVLSVAGTPSTLKWLVLYSKDGSAPYTVVDTLAADGTSADPVAGALSHDGKSVAFTGMWMNASGLGALETRTAALADPTTWTEMDQFVPNGADGAARHAGGGGIVFAHDGSVFVAGRSVGPTVSFPMVRAALIPTLNFATMDFLLEPRMSDLAMTDPVGGIGTAYEGDVVAAHFFIGAQNAASWVVRKLACN